MCAASAWADEFKMEVSGDADTAPIYALEGSGVSQFSVGGTVNVSQELTYSMDTVASGNVTTTGIMAISRAPSPSEDLTEWDARCNADSTYRISNYGDLIVTSFNHRLKSPAGEKQIIDGDECDSAQISSKGRMFLVRNEDNTYEFEGVMSGNVQGSDIAGKIVKNYPYRDWFTQSITGNFDNSDWAKWTGTYEVIQEGRKIIGSGELEVGPEDDPVDTVEQNLKGSYDSKRDIFSWNAAGSGQEKKVTIKITHDGEDSLIDGKNQVTAAGQSRKF